MKKLIKHKKSFTYLFLISYTFLISLTVLHYHHVDIQENDFIITQANNYNDSGPFDKLIDLTHSCPILQFASTILSYNHVTHFSSIFNIGEQDFTPCETKHCIIPFTYKNNPLRAPPSQ